MIYAIVIRNTLYGFYETIVDARNDAHKLAKDNPEVKIFQLVQTIKD